MGRNRTHLPVGESEQTLAAWRRAGKGIWHVTVIIDGFDEVFDLRYPGGLSEKQVRKLARKEVAKIERQCLRYVHVTSAELKELP